MVSTPWDYPFPPVRSCPRGLTWPPCDLSLLCRPGPPQINPDEVKEVVPANVGDSVKLLCPVSSGSHLMIDWYKVGTGAGLCKVCSGAAVERRYKVCTGAGTERWYKVSTGAALGRYKVSTGAGTERQYRVSSGSWHRHRTSVQGVYWRR